MKKKIILAVAVFASIGLLTDCKKTEQVIEPSRSVQQNENGYIELFPHAKVVSPELVNSLTTVSEDQLVFSKDNEFVENIKLGDILIGSVSEKAPDGFLRTVNKIDKINGSYVFYTSNASLEQAVKDGKVHVEFPIVFNDIENTEVGKVSGFTSSTSKTINTSNIFYDKDLNNGTTSDQVRTNGSLVLSANMSVDMNFSWGSLTYFDAKTVFTATNSQTLTIGASVPFLNKSKVLYTNNTFPSVTFYVGAVPIVIKPKLDIFAQITGDINAAVSYSYKGTAQITPQIKYTKSTGWKTYAAKSVSLTGIRPNATLSGELEASVNAKITFSLYGCQKCSSAFLQAGVFGGLEFTATPSISKKLSAGFKVGAGATLFAQNVAYDPFFKYTAFSY